MECTRKQKLCLLQDQSGLGCYTSHYIIFIQDLLLFVSKKSNISSGKNKLQQKIYLKTHFVQSCFCFLDINGYFRLRQNICWDKKKKKKKGWTNWLRVLVILISALSG